MFSYWSSYWSIDYFDVMHKFKSSAPTRYVAVWGEFYELTELPFPYIRSDNNRIFFTEL